MKLKNIGLLICFVFVAYNTIGKTLLVASSDSIPAKNLYKNSWDSRNTRSAAILGTQQYFLPLNVDNENAFVFPCRSDVKICSDYGPRGSRTHTGVDIKLNHGDSIVSAWDGVVRIASEGYYGYGKLVVVRHNNGLETFYAHLSKVEVEENQIVHAGDLLGLAGRTGRASTDHLHFETRFLFEHFNPHIIIDFNDKTLITSGLKVENKKFSAWKTNDIEIDTTSKPEESDTATYYEDLFENLANGNDTIDTNKTPQPSPQKTQKPVVHIIKQGDTLYALSKKYHISINEMCRLNNINPESILRLGQKIKLR